MARRAGEGLITTQTLYQADSRNDIGQRHAALADVLLRFVSSRRPSDALRARCASALETLMGDDVPRLGAFTKRMPALLVFSQPFKAKTRKDAALERAIRIAAFVAETDPVTSGAFCNHDGARLGTVMGLFPKLALEGLALPIRIIRGMWRL